MVGYREDYYCQISKCKKIDDHRTQIINFKKSTTNCERVLRRSGYSSFKLWRDRLFGMLEKV